MTEILRTAYSLCMQCVPMVVHPQYIQVSFAEYKMLVPLEVLIV